MFAAGNDACAALATLLIAGASVGAAFVQTSDTTADHNGHETSRMTSLSNQVQQPS